MATDLCSSVGGNTSAPGCSGTRETPKKFSVGTRSFTYAEYSDADTYQAAFLAAHLLPTGDANKLYAFPEIFEVDPKTEGDTEGSLTLGPKVRLRKGRPSYTYTVDVSWAEYQKLLAFDGKKMPVYTLDDNSQLWSYRPGSIANTPNTKDISGELAYITISGAGFKNGADVKTGKCTITVSYLSVDDFEKRGVYALLPNLSANDLVGLQDIMMSEPVAHTSNVYKVKFTIPVPQLGGDRNIYPEYGAALAALTFTAFTGAIFTTSLAITSVAVDATNQCLTVTFDSTAFGLLASGAKIKLKAPTVAALSAADIGNDTIKYEISDIILTK